MKKLVVALVGTSGSGKSFYEKGLFELGFEKVISVTSRPKRGYEIEGKHYRFKTLEELEGLKLIELTGFCGNYYGMEESELFKNDKPVVVVMEPRGLLQLQDYCNNSDKVRLVIMYFKIPYFTCLMNMVLLNSRGLFSSIKRLWKDSVRRDSKLISPDLVIRNKVFPESLSKMIKNIK